MQRFRKLVNIIYVCCHLSERARTRNPTKDFQEFSQKGHSFGSDVLLRHINTKVLHLQRLDKHYNQEFFHNSHFTVSHGLYLNLHFLIPFFGALFFATARAWLVTSYGKLSYSYEVCHDILRERSRWSIGPQIVPMPSSILYTMSDHGMKNASSPTSYYFMTLRLTRWHLLT